MNFVGRKQILMDRLQWAPSRGPKRQALLDELRQLVTAQLRRELSSPPAAEPHLSATEQDDDARPFSSRSTDPYGGHPPYWIEL